MGEDCRERVAKMEARLSKLEEQLSNGAFKSRLDLFTSSLQVQIDYIRSTLDEIKDKLDKLEDGITSNRTHFERELADVRTEMVSRDLKLFYTLIGVSITLIAFVLEVVR